MNKEIMKKFAIKAGEAITLGVCTAIGSRVVEAAVEKFKTKAVATAKKWEVDNKA